MSATGRGKGTVGEEEPGETEKICTMDSSTACKIVYGLFDDRNDKGDFVCLNRFIWKHCDVAASDTNTLHETA